MRLLGWINILLVAGLVVSAFVLYGREHKTRMAEREIRKINAAVAREEEAMRILKVEWAKLASPQRLEKLAGERLKLAVVPPTRIRPASGVLANTPRVNRLREKGIDSLDGLISQVQKDAGGEGAGGGEERR